ncbi:uncharacterized protein LOC143892597 [Tasmannia lanceolata]|uniref:uncharacterized protein LOC143892597 n=1 Tax=Tasmannia lanceolata TaxID=3420 RepID=UPI004063ABB8
METEDGKNCQVCGRTMRKLNYSRPIPTQMAPISPPTRPINDSDISSLHDQIPTSPDFTLPVTPSTVPAGGRNSPDKLPDGDMIDGTPTNSTGGGDRRLTPEDEAKLRRLAEKCEDIVKELRDIIGKNKDGGPDEKHLQTSLMAVGGKVEISFKCACGRDHLLFLK